MVQRHKLAHQLSPSSTKGTSWILLISKEKRFFNILGAVHTWPIEADILWRRENVLCVPNVWPAPGLQVDLTSWRAQSAAMYPAREHLLRP